MRTCSTSRATRRGIAVTQMLMVDLPGQGTAPMRGLTFRADMAAPVSAALDFLATHAACLPEKVAVLRSGVSGGGFITGQAAASDPLHRRLDREHADH